MWWQVSQPEADGKGEAQEEEGSRTERKGRAEEKARRDRLCPQKERFPSVLGVWK